MMTDKLLFRKQALKMRSELFPSAEEKKAADLKIFENLKASGLIGKAELVLTYVSYRDETDTLKLIEYLLGKGKTVAVPRCRMQGQMDFFTIKDLSDLKPSSMGIPEPEYDERYLVVILPVLCASFREQPLTLRETARVTAEDITTGF